MNFMRNSLCQAAKLFFFQPFLEHSIILQSPLNDSPKIKNVLGLSLSLLVHSIPSSLIFSRSSIKPAFTLTLAHRNFFALT